MAPKCGGSTKGGTISENCGNTALPIKAGMA